MPAFALLGLPWLASVLGGLFTGLVSFLLVYLTKRFAVFVAAMIAIIALTTGFFAAIELAIAGIAVAVPVEISQGMGLIAPDNTTACLTAALSASVLRYVYIWNVRIIQWKLL